MAIKRANPNATRPADLRTTAARPDARVALASSPWATPGAFYRYATAGVAGVAAFRWRLQDAEWIIPCVPSQTA